MTKDEALKLALEALEAETVPNWKWHSYHPKIWEAITAIKQALEEPTVQEPEHIVHSNGRYSPLLTHMMNKRVESNVKQVIHLYDEPPAAQPAVPLTDEQKLMCWSRATHDADVEHKTEHQCLMDYGSEIEAAHNIRKV